MSFRPHTCACSRRMARNSLIACKNLYISASFLLFSRPQLYNRAASISVSARLSLTALSLAFLSSHFVVSSCSGFWLCAFPASCLCRLPARAERPFFASRKTDSVRCRSARSAEGRSARPVAFAKPARAAKREKYRSPFAESGSVGPISFALALDGSAHKRAD